MQILCIMRRTLCLLFVGSLTLTSCLDPEEVVYEPILMPRSQLESSIDFLPPEPLVQTGKMMLYQDLYFVIEHHKGVHVFDVSDVDQPNNLGFIRVPGCIDIIAKDGYLYVDNAVDLVTLKWERTDVVEVDRDIEVFEPIEPPLGVERVNYANIPDDAVIVGWRIK